MSCFCEVEADHIKEQPHIVSSPGASQDGVGELQGCSYVEECWKPKCETLGDLWVAFWPQVKWFCLRCDFHCVLLPPLGKCQRSCRNWPLKWVFSRQKSDKAWTEVSLLYQPVVWGILLCGICGVCGVSMLWLQAMGMDHFFIPHLVKSNCCKKRPTSDMR